MDLTAAIGALAAWGFAQILAEGGPSLNAQLAAAGLIDEVCLTVSPLLAFGDASGSWPGPAFRAARSGASARSVSRTDYCSSAPARPRPAHPGPAGVPPA
ncbi:dihydrofolate reductase family protein [Trebonia kvetii]|uniref:dihydrofolate reductase family protein n=1 Tax=Trebonia kvetii TaxID=2480626 RepID=UPI001FE7DD29|nr:dihydrofolate reductase family protein [Trebonia kvetii]